MKHLFALRWSGRRAFRRVEGRALVPAPALEGLEARLVMSHGAGLHGAALARQQAALDVNLSPPVYSLRSEVNATVGKTPGVVVGPLTAVSEGQFVINVTAQSKPRAVALASVLSPTIVIGNETVQINVIGPGGARAVAVVPTSAQQLASLEGAAFQGNKLFKNAVVGQASPISPPAVFPVFAKAVVQFYDDNLADLSHNTNRVAAQAFGDALAPEPGGFTVHPSTVAAPDDGGAATIILPRGPRSPSKAGLH